MFLTPHPSTHLYDDTYLRQIQRSLAVQSGASVIPRASWGIPFTHPFCSCSCFRWLGIYRERNLPVRAEPLPHH
jgi:hypothetical protein